MFHFAKTSSILPGRPSRFSGVDTSLPVEELRVREYEKDELRDGETRSTMSYSVDLLTHKRRLELVWIPSPQPPNGSIIDTSTSLDHPPRTSMMILSCLMVYPGYC
ncbi:uncharacterized protein LOC111326315 [Stylophora pistillata]|uniref:uncharacterized protein LOC111326315 n=1 Tax=Stylophora pistillata TaxID=50429 RepID=UPI000C050B70|nr:uncharacterized protein LOC111326315 [Stylophora pistillata]